jgi:DNA-binding MarR family transcriptional regulator
MNNTELAKQVGVTKQAMSQMIATLVKRGVLKITQNTKDSRSKLIALSDYGLEFDKYFSSSIDELMKEYTTIIGEAKMSVVTDILMELSNGIIKQKFERQS